MSVTSYVKRRICAKIHPVFKRVVFPVVGMLFLIQVLTFADRRPALPDVVPGEALDPIVTHKVHNPQDTRPSHPFDSVLQAAAKADERRMPRDVMVEGVKKDTSKDNFVKESKMAEYLKKKEKEQKKLNQKKSQTKEKKKNEKKENEKSKTEEKKKTSGAGITDSEWSMAKLNIPGHDQVEFDGHKITERTVTLTVMSSADKVFMSLNKREIYRGLEDRGIHVVVLHPHTGQVMASRVFDTFFNGTETDMAQFLDDLQEGRIVVFAVRDEAATGLTWRGRSKLREFGSRFADRLAYRDMWILVTRKSGLKLAESYSNVAVEDTAYEWGGPLFLRTDFDLTELADPCDWEDKEIQGRQSFCQKYEGYGELCRCSVKTMEEAFFQADGKEVEGIVGSEFYNDLAVAVLATNRPNYLYRTLKSLREAPGYNQERVIVFTEHENEEVSDLVDLFGVKLVVTGVRDQKNTTASVRIRDKIQFIFRDIMGASFPNSKVPSGMDFTPGAPTVSANHLVLLDEDIRVSVDFFKFLHSLAPVLHKDPTVLGITALNYNSYVFTAESLTTFYRTDRPHHLALLLPARSVHELLVNHWPDATSESEWYTSIAMAMDGHKAMDIILPEVSRAKHFGYTGHKILGTVQHSFFHDHTLALTTDYTIPIDNINRLSLSEYEAWRVSSLKEADPVSFNFCLYDLPYGKDRKVVYVDYAGGEEDKYILALFKCLGAWHVYPEGGWRDTWDFVYHGHPITVVAVPASKYSYFKPTDYKMPDLTEEKETNPH